MENFAVRFLLCNIIISILIGMLLAAKRLLKKRLTCRMQYRLWFLMFGIFTVPFLPVQAVRFLPFLSWIKLFGQEPASFAKAAQKEGAALSHSGAFSAINDFGMAVGTNTPSAVGLLLFVLWIAGITAAAAFTLKSASRFSVIKKSALPLQNRAIRKIYRDCLTEMKITKHIPVYSTAFLKSPVIAGIFKPRIYLPIHLISDGQAKDIRYMLLHELTHYRHKDAFINCLALVFSALYWFNPAVRYALNEMKNDREIACDASVLDMLAADDYKDYGTTLINFAEKITRLPFPFVSGLGGNMAQMQNRIINIASYQKPSAKKILSGFFTCMLIAVLLSGFIPALAIQAANPARYFFPEQGKHISYLDLQADFGGYDGSFVLYDAQNDAWQIYNKKRAVTRVSPVSTYKIYSALFGLETGIISPENSRIAWNGQRYEYELWNADQTLASAMKNSVTWYFQEIDRQAGLPAVKDFIQKTGYGSQGDRGDITSYWVDSTLSISPIEQIEMLKKFYYNDFGFSPEHIAAVKESILLYTNGQNSVYGKTGTGETDGKNTLGWFIGYVEQNGHPYFFATTIQNDENASGPAAADLTFSILSGQTISLPKF